MKLSEIKDDNFGEWLIERMSEKGYGVSDFADKVGLSRQQVTNLRNGTTDIMKCNYKTVVKIAEVLDMQWR